MANINRYGGDKASSHQQTAFILTLRDSSLENTRQFCHFLLLCLLEESLVLKKCVCVLNIGF